MQRYFAINKSLELSNEDKHHIINVMRMNIKDKFNIIFEDYIYECIIEEISKKNIKYKVINSSAMNTNKTYKLILAVALIKEQKFDFILQKATELGVDEIIPIETERTIIHIDKSNEQNKNVRWLKICKEASEQSHRNNIPKIHNIIRLKDLVNYKKDLNIACIVNETSTNIKQVLNNIEKYGTILVVIGPEGGFTRSEEEFLISNDFISTSLGENVLRTETVPLYILSIINYEYMR